MVAEVLLENCLRPAGYTNLDHRKNPHFVHKSEHLKYITSAGFIKSVQGDADWERVAGQCVRPERLELGDGPIGIMLLCPGILFG